MNSCCVTQTSIWHYLDNTTLFHLSPLLSVWRQGPGESAAGLIDYWIPIHHPLYTALYTVIRQPIHHITNYSKLVPRPIYTVALSTCIHLSGKVFSYLNTYGHDTNIDRNLKNLKLLLFCKSGDVMEQLLWSPLPAALYRWDATRNPFRPQCCPKVLRELHEVHQTSISWQARLDFSFKFGFEN